MEAINLNDPNGEKRHTCKSYRSGDWIVFYCEKCKNYERRLNWRTGEMKVKNGKGNVRHRGFHAPGEYRDAFEDVN